MPVPHYSHLACPLARDLAWLLDDTQDLAVDLAPFACIRNLGLAPLTHEDFQQMVECAFNDSELSSKFSRLGIYFEDLVELWLTVATRPHGDVRRSIQLRDPTSGSTLGEIDFAFALKDLRHHLEVAVKFYAGWEDGAQWQWLGENPCDSLAGKCEHLRHRQLPRSLHLPWITGTRSYWLKGRLFEPVTGAPAGLPPAKGGWCYARQLPLAAARWPGSYAALPYARWLGGLELREARQQARPLAAWSGHAEGLTRSLMLTSVEHDIADRWRVWIMPEHWPHPPGV